MVGNVFSFIEGCIIVYPGKRGRKNQWKNQTGYINFGVLESSNDSFNVEFHQLLVIYFQTNRNLWRENYIEKFDMLKPLTFWFIQCRCDHCLLSCDLNSSVRGRVSSSRKRFWTLPNLYSEVSA